MSKKRYHRIVFRMFVGFGGMELSKFREKGIALITVLLISIILLIFGAILLQLYSHDYRQARLQEKKIEVFYVAKGGLEYYRSRGEFPPADESTGEKRIYIPQGNRNQYCLFKQENGAADLIFEGNILIGNGQSVSCSIIAPGGDLDAWYQK